MQEDRSIFDHIKKIMLARYPRFDSQIAETNFEFNSNLKYHTAATDGKTIYFDPQYLASLSEDEKLFLVAHEFMHIKFEHMFRLSDKNGKMRNLDIWNEATDAIINANLERDGFKIKDGYVNIPGARKYNAEELYAILLKEKQEQQKNKDNDKNKNQQQNGQNQQNQEGGQGSNQENQENEDKDKDKQESGENSQKDNDVDKSKDENSSQNENGDDEKSSGDNGQGNSQEQGEENQDSEENDDGQGDSTTKDDHSLWEEAYNKRMNGQEDEDAQDDKDKQDKTKKQDKDSNKNKQKDYNEKEEFEKNREERKERARQRFERLKNRGFQESQGKVNFGELEEAKPILDWKMLLRREIEKDETIWSQRRSIAENNYAFRLEDNEIEDESETEIILDTSGSVSVKLLKNFLRQVKTILKDSKIKVGTFSSNFHGFVEIKKASDIDKLEIDVGGGTNFDAASRAFTKKKEVNKICFTDGQDFGDAGIREKRDDIIWITFENVDFKPDNGKVIFAPKSKFNMHLEFDEPEMY